MSPRSLKVSTRSKRRRFCGAHPFPLSGGSELAVSSPMNAKGRAATLKSNRQCNGAVCSLPDREIKLGHSRIQLRHLERASAAKVIRVIH